MDFVKTQTRLIQWIAC